MIRCVLPDLFFNLVDTVFNLLCNLHNTIFFNKPYFLSNLLECHQVKLGAKFDPQRRTDLTGCLLFCDGLSG